MFEASFVVVNLADHPDMGGYEPTLDRADLNVHQGLGRVSGSKLTGANILPEVLINGHQVHFADGACAGLVLDDLGVHGAGVIGGFCH